LPLATQSGPAPFGNLFMTQHEFVGQAAFASRISQFPALDS
jgi:hypothetical protein